MPAALGAAAALRAILEEQERLVALHESLTELLAGTARSIPDTEVFLAPDRRRRRYADLPGTARQLRWGSTSAAASAP